jgi:hypothetical protein
MITSIQGMWERYAKMVLKELPEDSIQYKETRKAFYAGAIDMFTTMQDIAGRLSETDSLKVFTEIESEIRTFSLEIIMTHKRRN